MEPRARASRPTAGREGWRGQDHDQTVAEHLEPVTVLGFGQVPGARRTWRRILRIPECPTVRRRCGVQWFGARLRHQLRRAMHGPSDSRIGAAATDVAVQGVVDGRVVRIRVAGQEGHHR